MLFLRIKQAEVALKDGRLDEAFALAEAQDFRAHYRGQRLIGRLARALVTRGQQHMAEQRLREAGGDCEKAQRLAGGLPEAAALKTALLQADTEKRREQRVQNDAVAAAREHLDAGRLSLAGKALAAGDAESTRIANMQDELAARRERAGSALSRASAALQHEDWAAAVAALSEARRAHPTDPRLTELKAQISEALAGRVRTALQQGALDVATSLVSVACPLHSVELRELQKRVEQLGLAAAYVTQGHLREAVERLKALRLLLPEVKWIADAIPCLEQAAGALEDVRSGPLRLLMDGTGAPLRGTVPVTDSRRQPGFVDGDCPPQRRAQDTVRLGAMPLPGRFLMQVDGVGSFLVVRQRRVTVGPVSSSRRPDVALLAEASLPVVTIERNDEDYVLTSSQPVSVNGAAVTRKLLASNDRIALSPRCRLRFTLPNAASTSAVLHVSGARLPQTDARRVILMGDSLVIGPSASAHITTGQLQKPAVLHVRDDRLLCRSPDPVAVGGETLQESGEIVLGARVSIGNLSFVVTGAEGQRA